MSEEIKEILKKTDIDAVSYGVIINYITNLQKENNQHISDIQVLMNKKENLERLTKKLQKENEKLKELEYKFFYCSEDEESFTLDDYLKIGNELYDCEEKLKDYKSRNEKAVEYIENAQERDESYEACSLYIPDLLNILQGGDE